MTFDQRLEELKVSTPGRGFTRLNERLNTWLAGTGLKRGMLHLTCLHTSASFPVKVTYKIQKQAKIQLLQGIRLSARKDSPTDFGLIHDRFPPH